MHDDQTRHEQELQRHEQELQYVRAQADPPVAASMLAEAEQLRQEASNLLYSEKSSKKLADPPNTKNPMKSLLK